MDEHVPITRDDYLDLGQTFFTRTWHPGIDYVGDGGWKYFPVQILKPARRGEFGARVECSDGINRYANGGYVGRNRSDSWTRILTHKLNPNYVQEMKPHVQLSLFD